MWPFSIKKGDLTRNILTKLQNLLCSLRSGEMSVISELTREKDIAVTEVF
jgi:hypothetical protein